MKMMLSHKYKEDKVKFPCRVSRKYDGVPVIFWVEDGEVFHATRQGKQLESIDHIIKCVEHWYCNQNKGFDGMLMVGELYIEKKPFQEISGLVRKKQPCPELELKIFELTPYFDWLDYVSMAVHDQAIRPIANCLDLVQQFPAEDMEALQEIIEKYPRHWEGLIVRHGEYMHGKRSWNSMKVKADESVDLRVVGFEEAIDKNGEPKGMIGSLICEFEGREIKVGPGKLIHAEREDIWNNPLLYWGKIAQIHYMKDDAYTDLRQPTFQLWRDDKDEVNEEV